MKKTIIASSLAVGLGVVAGNAGQADASESQINKAELAQLAESNDQSLNQGPIQEGAYDYQFNLNGKSYHFWSDGTYFQWEYHPSNGATVDNTAQQQASTQATGQQASTQDTSSYNQEAPQQTSNQQQSNTTQPTQTQQAPQTEQTQQPQQATSNTNQSSQSSSEASSGSSVNVNSHLQQIAQRESGGDIKAVNPSSGAAGKYQFLQSTWDSVAPAEYKGVSPTQAPEHVQDAAAVKLYNTAGASQWVTA
ncbi:transglycosylase family protein [Staphylococcus caledonicus]|uniref:transglycosylase family protein n=1 Tax=Staphylococcus caledonicus TaxID=2741333 RepID=UPI0018E44CDA|nr:transglycosylase family protein [Staphylococcus caledonicus]MBI5973833.1 transglycosylase family protein [Staphylococcus caledonicus]